MGPEERGGRGSVNRQLELVASYRSYWAEQGRKPKPVWGVYDVKDVLQFWSVAKCDCEKQLRRNGGAEVTIVPYSMQLSALWPKIEGF